MREILFILITTIISLISTKEILDFKKTKILEIEKEIKKHDFLFVLFFDR